MLPARMFNLVIYGVLLLMPLSVLLSPGLRERLAEDTSPEHVTSVTVWLTCIGSMGVLLEMLR